MSTPHNEAQKGEIANVVLMPGDPLRAEFIANTFLENPVQFNNVRGMKGFTGTWKGVPVSVMGSGMGMPSIGIYSYELFDQYGVDAIIRIGSAGGYSPDLHLFDVVLADSALSESTYAKTAFGFEENVLEPSAGMNALIEEAAEKQGKKVHKGRIHSHDVFYSNNTKSQEFAKENGCDAVEMESFALFANAKELGKDAACLVTISDSFVYPEEIATAEERQNNFRDMMEIALDAAIAKAGQGA